MVSIGESITMRNVIMRRSTPGLKHHVRTVDSDVVASSFHDMIATLHVADI